MSKPTNAPIDPASIRLLAGKGTPQRGGGPGGFYWHIYADQERAGNVFINLVDHPQFGRHASLQIQIHKRFHGRHIGRVAYRLACERSSYDTVYAHMRKSNLPSRKAAEAAGFRIVQSKRDPQLSMVWHRGA